MTRTSINKIISCIFILAIAFSGIAQKNNFPYALNYYDLAFVGVGSISLTGAKYIDSKQTTISTDAIMALNPSSLNSFDRSATNNWNNNANTTSEIIKFTLVASPSIILFNTAISKQWKNSICYATMYFETALLTYGLTELTKATSNRIRPYMYNSNISISEKQAFNSTNEVYDSFFSGSTSIAFASAVFFSKTYTDIFGKTAWSKLIWGSSLTLASTAGYLRYKSGNHFPTDVLTGAIVGSAIGYFIPVFHKTVNKNENISFLLSGNHIYATYTF